MNKRELSKIRKAASALGVAARWGQHKDKATACLRVYPRDAETIRTRAKAAKRLPADEVAAMLRR